MSPNFLKEQIRWALRLEADELRLSPELAHEMQACGVRFDQTPDPIPERGIPTKQITGIAGKRCVLVAGIAPREIQFFVGGTELPIATCTLMGVR